MKLKGLLRIFFFLILYMWNQNFSDAAILAPKVYSSSLCAWEIIDSFEEETCTFQYAPQLNWRAYNRTCFFNVFELYVDWNFPEAAILVPKMCCSSLYAWGVLCSFDEKIFTF